MSSRLPWAFVKHAILLVSSILFATACARVSPKLSIDAGQSAAPVLASSSAGVAPGSASSVSASPSEQSATANTADTSRSTTKNVVAEKPRAYFYTGKKYGNESQFNPINVVLNDGFAILQIPGADRHIFRFDYDGSFRNVAHAILHPFPDISAQLSFDNAQFHALVGATVN